MSRAAAFVAALSLGGWACVGAGPISRRAVSYNAAVEAARGEMLLLNILRARDRRPMVFTGLTRITGSVRTEGRVGATGPVETPRATVLSPGFTFSDSPVFDLSVLDSQEFVRGIMTPLSFDVVEYFWDQGFVREMLLYLVTERIEVACGADGARALENDPRHPTWPAFRGLIEALADGGRWETVDHLTESVGPPVDPAEVAKLPTLISVANARLRLDRRPDGSWQLVRPVERLRLVARADTGCVPGGEAKAVALYDSRRAVDTASGRPETAARLVVRSPQAVLFYLGEMARPGREVVIRAREAGQPEAERRLLVVRRAEECPAGLVWARYEGQRFTVPAGTADCHPGRSMQSIALAAQLLALQQSARDLPAAGTVRIIGQ